MKTIRSGKRLRSDGGQVTITVVLAMGIFLLGAMGFAVDMANLWFHRQSAQTAADAACTARRWTGCGARCCRCPRTTSAY